MKTPRNISGVELAKLLSIYGYSISRQTGSHIRLTTIQNGEHHLSVPSHSPLKIGTLNSIIKELSSHIGKSKQEIYSELLDA
ncbi:MAG: type II toxin-antitoxin system HicA family toxin [Desulfobulbaceae bacterium]|nr:type II toxin-antitoxin system HicA family toxin [Candidatus Kapabacteria bacterium]MBS4000402.1 type II toxin-antitoxin system HicA family toxin [Desulfobulbaceae bacterium]